VISIAPRDTTQTMSSPGVGARLHVEFPATVKICRTAAVAI
jgi:hypothetical protein